MKHATLLFLLLLFPTLHATKQLNITIIGTGYVGLVTGAGLAEIGNKVVCADIDAHKIEQLQQNIIPIYEVGLDKLVQHNCAAGRLSFTHDVAHAMQQADVIFIAVGTPMGEDGSADLAAVRSVVKTIAENLTSRKLIVTKSTVPIGTGAQLRALLEAEYHAPADMFELVSNPEFLREGSAIADFMYPDRIVIGTESDFGRAIMHAIYHKFIEEDEVPVVWTNIVTAESIKYACNGFLALKVSFINEIANVCDATGADVYTIAHAMGLDSRISGRFLRPGPGFGGSCFPKDSEALLHTAQIHNIALSTVQASLYANEAQKRKPVEKLLKLMHNDIDNKTIAVLGLAFKANTDDIRYSPTITAIEMLLEHGARVQVYDPQAMEHMRGVFPDILYCPSMYEALTGADGALIMTEWDEFKHIDFHKAYKIMHEPVIIDTRNILNAKKLKKHGFIFDYIGRSYLAQHVAARQRPTASDESGTYAHTPSKSSIASQDILAIIDWIEAFA